MSDFAELDARLAGLLDAVAPNERLRLARRIAAVLFARQSRRIAAQRNPDGSAYEPRKQQTSLRRKQGAIRRAMFGRLRTARWMRHTATPDAAVVSFAPAVQRMAQVHHFGLRDRVNRTSLMVRYPARRLLGLADDDIEAVRDLIVDHLARRD